MGINDIQLTAGIRNNLLLLQDTKTKIDRTQLRLSTGNKINSALDGPQQYFAARALNSRAGDLSILKDAMGQAISTITAADKGITSIQTLLEQAKGLTTTALSNLGNDAASVATRKSLSKQFDTIREQIDKLARDSGYQGKNLLVGQGRQLDADTTSAIIATGLAGTSGIRTSNVVSVDTYTITTAGTRTISLNVSQTVAAQNALGLTNVTTSGTMTTSTAANLADVVFKITGGPGQAKTITFTENGVAATTNNSQVFTPTGSQDGAALTVVLASGAAINFNVSVSQIETALNGQGNVSVSVEKFANITVTATNLTGQSIVRSGNNSILQGNKLAQGDQAFAFDTGTVRMLVNIASLTVANSTLTTKQIADATEANNIVVQFNETNTTSIRIVSQNVQTDGQGLQLDAATNNWVDRADVDRAAAQLTAATSQLRAASAAIATNLNIVQTRSNFTDQFVNVLTEGANKLTLADQNEEGANLLTLQTRQQLGTISLSLANQSQQAILRLF